MDPIYSCSRHNMGNSHLSQQLPRELSKGATRTAHVGVTRATGTFKHGRNNARIHRGSFGCRNIGGESNIRRYFNVGASVLFCSYRPRYRVHTGNTLFADTCIPAVMGGYIDDWRYHTLVVFKLFMELPIWLPGLVKIPAAGDH